MNSKSWMLAISVSLVCAVSFIIGVGACLDRNPNDVTGNYDVTYDNALTVTLNIGGAVYVAETSETGTVLFDTAEVGMLMLDLNQFCGLDEVQCPSETLWTAVSIDQPFPNATDIINVIDNGDPNPPPGTMAGVVGGLTDENNDFVLVLGAGLAGIGTNCALLGLSLATGTFTEDVSAEIDGIENGIVAVGFLGGCAWPGIAVGASLLFETGYTAVKTGPFDPPPFVPIDPDDTPPGIEEGTTDGGLGTDSGVGTDSGL